MSIKNRSTRGGGGNKTLIPAQKSSNFKTLVALGLSSLLPSFAFSAESNEALNQLLTTAPKEANNSKIKSVENYSPIVDLRSSPSSQAVEYDEIWNTAQKGTKNWSSDTHILIQNSDSSPAGVLNFSVENNATITFDADVSDFHYHSAGSISLVGVYDGAGAKFNFSGDGTFVFNVGGPNKNTNNIVDQGAFISVIDHSTLSGLSITSKFKFKAINKLGSFLTIVAGNVGSYGNGTYIVRSPHIEMNMKTEENSGTGQYIFYNRAGFSSQNTSYPNFYINAGDDGNVDNRASIQKYDGNFYFNSGKLFLHLTNKESYINGNIELGNNSSLITFSDGASMLGDFIFFNQNTGNHSIIFDNANFQGAIKDTSGSNNRSSNTLITFTNTAGNTFGNGNNDIVTSSYKGKITGSFDISSTSATTINGGEDGSKGFFGAGENTLFFDFKGSVRDNTPENKRFTIGGGNANSVYVINAFQKSGESTFNLSNLSAQDNTTLYNKLGNAGVNIAVDTLSDDSKNHLNGTLFFQKTNMTVGDGNNALFANQANIVGADNALNGLALGAMFGNATWNDTNKDGSITSEEITPNNGGTNYKLSASTPASGENINDTTSTGNIGSANDEIKKQVAFIFDKSSYTFGGDKQGYSGIINGGTSDSKYYFANAGYIGRTQIAGALGDLVLFNTAFRGDLGVNNDNVSIMLDFSEGRNGLRAESGDANANIVGAGSKNVTFNFTNNTQVIKFAGSVVGDANKTSGGDGGDTADSGTAKYTMLNLVKYRAGENGGTVIDGNGSLTVATVRAGSGKTLIDAIQGAGLSNFNKPLESWSADYPNDTGHTDVSTLSTTNTTLALRGTSLDAENIDFSDYIYDFAFGSGAEIGSVEGVILNDSKLKGVIDLTANGTSNSKANENSGHSFVFKGTAIDGTNSGVLASNGQLAGFSYDDSSAEYQSAVTFELSGLYYTNNSSNSYISNTASNKVKGDSLVFTQTNLEGNLWADNSIAVNLDFTGDRTWKMDSSGIFLQGSSNIQIHGKVASLSDSGNTPILKLRNNAGDNLQNFELINTGMIVKLWQFGGWGNGTRIGSTFNLRGTSLETFWSDNGTQGNVNGLHGYADNGIKLVFAKGANTQTTLTTQIAQDGQQTPLNITDEATGDGNYIAESYGKFTKVVTKKSFDITFIGKESVDYTKWGSAGGYFGEDSKLTFVNASSSTSESNGYADGGGIGRFLSHQNSGGNSSARADIVIKGTSIDWGTGIVARGNNQDKLFYDITFVNDGGQDDTYISSTQYADLATTDANGALKDSILKVQESKLVSGLNFKDANATVLFVGNASQSLDGTVGSGGQSGNDKILKGGSASSVFTFRDSDLNAGNGTNSSIQNIKGTIAFDLTHTNEDMQISGTLKNMLATGGKHQVQFTGKEGSAEPVTLDRLVFVKMSDLPSLSASLGTLETSGNYFNDAELFGDLSQADYSDLALLADVDDNKSSSLTFADNATIALESGEAVFVGANSHKFGADSDANKLGNSTGGNLTFIDAGTLKIDNLLNVSGSTQQGKGTINLIGTTRIETQSIQSANTLTLKKGDATGVGITVNAVFTGSNILGTGVQVKDSDGSATSSFESIASNVNIGQEGEQTAYHILFDYSEALKNEANTGFGKYQVYQGTITGLTNDSVIKFKNAGYITNDQIANTNANILVDNTQIKGDFKGDRASLDFRNNQSAVDGNILTSDPASVDKKLSRKILTFDLTGSDTLEFGNAIQAGYKIATAYDTNGQSILTFQNARDLTLGDSGAGALRGARTLNSSAFIQSLATDAGFSGIAEAKTEESDFNGDNSSYILKGTKLAFQGTNIDASALDNKTITEDLYSLDLSFDKSDATGQTALGETLAQSVLTANSIVMGALNEDNPLGLSLSFKNQGSLVGVTKANEDETISFSNVLDVKLKDNAIFNLNAKSSNGNIGTIVLLENTPARVQAQTDTLTLLAQSSMNIQAGAMNFVGVFDTSADASTQADDYGTLNLSFGDVYQTDDEGNVVTDASGNKVVAGNNKAYGIIAHKGAMNVNLTGDALLSDEEAQVLGYTKSEDQFANLVLDIANASNYSLTLNHTSGVVGLIGKSQSGQYSAINLNSATGNLALKGNFDLGQANLSFVDENKSIKLADNVVFKVANNGVLNFQGNGLVADAPLTLTINSSLNTTKIRRDFTFVNISPNITIELKSLGADGMPSTNDWGVGGIWKFRGTNLKITSAFWSESNAGGNLQSYVFAKGSGTETEDSTKLSELTSSDRINESTLTGELVTRTADNNIRNLILKNAEMTFIGKESLGIEGGNQKIDGTNGKITFGFYNGLIKSGYLILDNTNNGGHGSLGNTGVIQDVINLAGTDTFNLSVNKSGTTTGANNSTINAVFVNGTTQANSADSSITGVRYIDSSASYASAYATNNAGGALSETQLKTLESKAYGNITLDTTVTATMKFIGENSHSFDGKTKVDSSNGNVYYSADGQSNWKQYTIGNGTGNVNGAVYLASTTTETSGFALATLTGGKTASNSDEVGSRFDFDRTSVSLEQIKKAGGDTYIYNSNIIGNIKVTDEDPATIPTGSTTTIFFNQAYTPADMPTAVSTFASEYAEKKDINLDLTTAHILKASNLESGKLSTTSKTTNLVLLGAGSVENANDNGNILLNFLPEASTSSNYNYTIVSGGLINIDDYRAELGGNQTSGSNEVTGQEQSVFGDSNVVLIDTILQGTIVEGVKGFINVERNTRSVWGGDTDQFLIFNFNDGASDQKLYFGKANGIRNISVNSRYIFSGIFANSSFANSPRVLTLTDANSLKAVINNKLGITAISDDVKGYLGLRGISVQGNINEDTTDGNGVDIVFNSTNNLAYKEGFDESGKHYANIVEGANLVSTDLRDDSKISGYAVLKTAEGEQTVTILGNANKDIAFIGEGAVEGGFDKLVITEGSKDSNYTFHTVGKLSETFLGNVGLFHSENSRATNEAVAGNFKFVNSTIVGDINANQSSADSGRTNTLKFENVNYSGTISGTLKKDLVFGAGSDKIKIIGGSEDSVYDFSNLAGKSIELDIDLSNGSSGYINSVIAGFKEGNISVVGYLNVESSSRFAFNDNASWTLTESSKVGNLELNNSGTNFNLNLASAPRTASQVGAEGQPSNDLRVLEVNNLYTEGGQVLLGTAINQEDQSLSQSDKINTKAISGTLYVTAEDASIEKGSFDTENNAIVLVTSGYIEGEVKGAQRKQGLSYSVTELEHQVSDGNSWSEATAENTETAQSHRWVLSSLNTETNQELVDESGFIVSNPYRMLVIETNNLNKRMGDLRDDNYNQGAWIRVFNGMDSGEGAKNLYTNIQLGYDYGTPAIGAKNYTGVAFSTSIVDIDGNQYSGKANTYSLAAYNAYIADSGLYVDTIVKYLYTDQKVSPAGSSDSSFGSHALSLGVEVGYRAYMGETNFYIEPQAEAIGGIIFGVKDINMGVVGGMNINGELKTTTTINTRVGLVQGYSLKTQSGFRADFRLGVSLVNEFVSESDPVRLYDGVTEASTSIGNDTKAVVNVGTNLILTDQWRVYIDAERSFGGSRNVDYQANVGARFSFGDTSKPAPTHHEQYKAIATPLKVDNLKEHKEESESEAQVEKQQDKKTK